MKKQALLAASMAGLLAAVGAATATPVVSAEEVHCYGINKCKGTGDCGGKGHACAGQNACKGTGFISLEKEDCLKVQGGRLTENAQ